MQDYCELFIKLFLRQPQSVVRALLESTVFDGGAGKLRKDLEQLKPRATVELEFRCRLESGEHVPRSSGTFRFLAAGPTIERSLLSKELQMHLCHTPLTAFDPPLFELDMDQLAQSGGQVYRLHRFSLDDLLSTAVLVDNGFLLLLTLMAYWTDNAPTENAILLTSMPTLQPLIDRNSSREQLLRHFEIYWLPRVLAQVFK